MDPRLIFVVLFIALRIFGVINRRRKQQQSAGRGMDGQEMGDLSGDGANPMNPMNRRRTGNRQISAADARRPKVFHKRDKEDPFDGLNGDVTQAKLTMDDIVTK